MLEYLISTSSAVIRSALAHRAPARVPVDFGATSVTGMHVSCVAALRRHYGIENGPVKVIDPGQMLGEIDEDLKRATGVDTEAVRARTARFGLALEDWKPWRMYDGLEVLVPGAFHVTIDENGDTLMHPQGDTSAPPSARMPKEGWFFDSIERQEPIEEERLCAEDNLEEYKPIGDRDLDHFERAARAAAATGRAVVASFGGTAFGDIANIPGVAIAASKEVSAALRSGTSPRARGAISSTASSRASARSRSPIWNVSRPAWAISWM